MVTWISPAPITTRLPSTLSQSSSTSISMTKVSSDRQLRPLVTRPFDGMDDALPSLVAFDLE